MHGYGGNERQHDQSVHASAVVLEALHVLHIQIDLVTNHARKEMQAQVNAACMWCL